MRMGSAWSGGGISTTNSNRASARRFHASVVGGALVVALWGLFPSSATAEPETQPFPRPVLGFYSVPVDACSSLAVSGFTVIQNYRFESRRNLDVETFARDAREYLDEAQRHGLRVLLGVPRNWLSERREDALRHVVRALRDHDAILAWYEDERGQEGDVGAVEFLDRVVAEEDPRHGLIIEEGRDLPRLRHIGRVRMFTFYPVTHEARRSGRLRTIRQRFPVDTLRVPFWPVLQVFGRDLISGYPAKNYLAPSLQELEYTLASALIAGAEGFFFYTYRLSTVYDSARRARGEFPFLDPKPLEHVSPRLWKDTLTIAAQARLLLHLLENAEPVDDIQLLGNESGRFEFGAWRIGQGLLVLVGNATYAAGPLTLAIPPGYARYQRLHGTRFGPLRSVQNGRVQVSIAGPGSVIMQLVNAVEEDTLRR